MLSRVVIDLDCTGRCWHSQDWEQRGVFSVVSDAVCASVCESLLRLELMTLMKMNLTQGSDDASASSLNSHTYSQKGYELSTQPQREPSIKPKHRRSDLECSIFWVKGSVHVNKVANESRSIVF